VKLRDLPQRSSIDDGASRIGHWCAEQKFDRSLKETTMRTTLLGFAALVALLALDAAPANAQVYPWCANYGGRGGTNCYFANLWQCQQAVSGTGGYCSPNPFYGEAPRATRRYGRY
jgi:hypothetical protein